MKALSQRNRLLDAMKAIAALGVIFVHFPFPGEIGRICASFGTVGVIFFFLISGYQSHCADPADSGKILRRFKRNLLLIAAVIPIFVIYTVVKQIALGTASDWVATYLLNPITYLRLIVLGDLDFINCGHLWYMVAMLYGYLIIYLMEKFRLHKLFYIALPVLLLLRASMETYTNSFSHFSWFDWHFSGNFLVGALPIMLLGSFISVNEEKLVALGTRVLLPAAAVMMSLVFLTVNIKLLGLDLSQPFKIAAATAFFMLCLTVTLKGPATILDRIGRHLTLHIYIWHRIVGDLFIDLLTYVRAEQWVYDWCLPVATIAVSLLISLFFARITARKRSA